MRKTPLISICAALTACFSPDMTGTPAAAETDGDAAETDADDPDAADDDDADTADTDDDEPDDGGPEDDGGDSSGGEDDGVCGDGIIDADEACDDGINDGTYGGCAEDCRTRLSACGDGVIDAGHGETCDDGNAVTGDGCNADCLESGRELWRDVIDAGAVFQEGRAVDVAPDGTVMTFATLTYDGSTAMLLRWYDADGTAFAANEIDGRGETAAQLDDGRYAVVLQAENYSNTVHFYNENNTLAWVHPDPTVDVNDLAVDHEDETIWITGSDDSGAYYESRGWSGALHFVGRPASSSCGFTAAVPNDGALVMCADALYRVSPFSNIRFTGAHHFGVTARSDGSYATQTGDEIFAFDADGNPQWDLYLDAGYYIAADEDGTLVVAGGGWGNIDGFLTKYSQDGNAQWTRSLDDIDVARPYAIDIGPDGMIVVTGFLYDGNAAGETDVLTVAYAP